MQDNVLMFNLWQIMFMAAILVFVLCDCCCRETSETVNWRQEIAGSG